MPRLVRLAVALAALPLAAAPAHAAAPPLPNSMAALGDSITRAYDACCSYGEHPERSWATGDLAGDFVTSHYERLAAANPALVGHAYNDAVTGAESADLLAQAQQAVGQGVDYVTVMIGSNDACAPTRAQMTRVATFRANVEAAFAALDAGLPNAHVFVASVPDLRHLWQIEHRNAGAQFIWAVAGVCQSVLSPRNTTRDRAAVDARVRAYNRVLQAVCAVRPSCRYDGGLTYRYRFQPSEVSSLDFFHPSELGQQSIANGTFPLSWWP